MPYLVYLCLRAKHCFFFTAANPGIENGGLMMESKWRIHCHAPDGFFPDTLAVDYSSSFAVVSDVVLEQFSFPFIAKPDIGSKGSGVSVIRDISSFRKYHQQCRVPYIVQRLIDLPEEAGIFYVKLPGAEKGMITGIVQKGFITVKGNGYATVRELLSAEPRYFLQLPALEKTLGREALLEVLPAGKEHCIIAVGNHARGALFTNASYRITPQLTAMIDGICSGFKGFYFGRLDIRFKDWDALEQGKDFAVIELNGSGSEPTHIYDPSQSIWFAWKEIIRHWRLLYKVSIDQHKKGVAYPGLKQVIAMIRGNARMGRLVREMELQ